MSPSQSDLVVQCLRFAVLVGNREIYNLVMVSEPVFKQRQQKLGFSYFAGGWEKRLDDSGIPGYPEPWLSLTGFVLFVSEAPRSGHLAIVDWVATRKGGTLFCHQVSQIWSYRAVFFFSV